MWWRPPSFSKPYQQLWRLQPKSFTLSRNKTATISWCKMAVRGYNSSLWACQWYSSAGKYIIYTHAHNCYCIGISFICLFATSIKIQFTVLMTVNIILTIISRNFLQTTEVLRTLYFLFTLQCLKPDQRKKMLQYTLHYNLLQRHSIIYNQYTIIPQAREISCLCPIIFFSVMVPVDLWLGCTKRRATENVKGW